MGERKVLDQYDALQQRQFMKRLLDDVQALELMLDRGMIESGARRIGAEQEMFLIDSAFRPAPVAMELLHKIRHSQFTTELARYNLEANLSPYDFGGDCLSKMEAEINELLQVAREAAATVNAKILLTGILPTLQLTDLGLENMTPIPRYFALNQAMTRLRGGAFHTVIKGLDELNVSHDNVMMESCNTSFQVHFQVSPQEFARLYNTAQAVSAPVLAASVNSPVFLGHRLWHETRVALFQHSVDARSATHQARGHRPRVSFGDAWMKESVLEIFREDIARFRTLLATPVDESPIQSVEAGVPPPLTALRIHNGTVYRWNRACYGVKDGVAHLRIENRALPAGPTVADEMANAAFFFGLMASFVEEYGAIDRIMPFDDAKGNFLAAARHGLNAQFNWMNGKTVTATEIIQDPLLRMARDGLKTSGVDSADIDRYLGIIEDRVESGRTGSKWAFDSLSSMAEGGTRDERYRTLAAATYNRQQSGLPVHKWDLATLDESEGWHSTYQTVGQFMTTDLFTVRPGDLVDLAASLMDWEHIRHVPVEDDDGKLVGLVSHRDLLRLIARGLTESRNEPVSVNDIMKSNVVTVPPETSALDAIAIMREQKVGCLPVVNGDHLVGVVTVSDFLDAAAEVFERELRES